MEINLEKENICINRQVANKKDILYVQGDVIVPDSKPDLLNTISTSGNVTVYKKEIMDGKIRINGNVNTYIMYLADNENDNIRGISTAIDFSETIILPECKQNMTVWIDTKIKNIDSKVLNGRKLNLKIGVEIQIKIFSREEIQIVNKINDDTIQMLEKKIILNSQVGEGSNNSCLKDNISINNNDILAEILKAEVNLVDKDIKVSYNKILVKSEAEIKIMYLTEAGLIKNVVSKIPIVGFIDIQNIKEENICDVMYEMKNIIIKPNSNDDHSIYVEIEVQISCMAYEEKEINLIGDLYSITNKVILKQDKINAISCMKQRKDICEIREKVKVNELENNNLIDVDIIPNIVNKTFLNNKIMYEGELSLNFIYLNDTSVGINSKIISVPFEYSISDIENIDNLQNEYEIEILKNEFNVQEAGTIACNVDLGFNTKSYKNEEINIINEVNLELEDKIEDYSLVIYLVKQGDTLWNIAKKFKSTVDDIVRINGIENQDKINIGEKLYIPKYIKNHVMV